MSDAADQAPAPRLGRVLETALYVDDLDGAAAFYEDLFGLQRIFEAEPIRVYDIGGGSIFLLFKRGGSVGEQRLPGGSIPGHDGAGPLHIAFAIERADLEAWERRLAERGVAIEGRMEWPLGGTSLYFRDPDGHLLELATPGLWKTY
jgi:catechol 2,3-dioxygenase-like lactoylglutathione lyase family enzyme